MDPIEQIDPNFFLPPQFALQGVPHVEEYFGLWAILEESLRSAVDRWNGTNLHLHVNSQAAKEAVAAQDSREYLVTRDGIAVFNISGPMMKYTSSMSGGTSTVAVRRQIGLARRDSEVAGGMLIMDTPGGTVRGNFDLAKEVAAFAAIKPIVSFTEDMTASAGVSIASQATKRYANNESALYGSMGTYGVLIDASGRAEQLGLKVHVIRAGAHKGTGEPGTAITDEQLAEVQRIINAMNETYVQLIASGLGKSADSIKAIADGRVHPASEALKMGLIDGIKSRDEVYAELVQTIAAKPFTSNRRNQAMDPNANKPAAATLAELKKTFPKSTADWREKQMEAGATVADAAIAYSTFLEEARESDKKAHEKALADQKTASDKEVEAAKAAGQKPGGKLGHNPVKVPKAKAADADQDADDVEQSGDPVEDFNALVAKAAGPNPEPKKRIQAMAQVARKHPELHKQYLLATNPGARAKRIITEKAEIFAGAE